MSSLLPMTTNDSGSFRLTDTPPALPIGAGGRAVVEAVLQHSPMVFARLRVVSSWFRVDEVFIDGVQLSVDEIFTDASQLDPIARARRTGSSVRMLVINMCSEPAHFVAVWDLEDPDPDVDGSTKVDSTRESGSRGGGWNVAYRPGTGWSDTGDVDPVLARACHALTTLGLPSQLVPALGGTRGSSSLSRRRAVLLLDGSLRRVLPAVIKNDDRADRYLAQRFESLPMLCDVDACAAAVSLTHENRNALPEGRRHAIDDAWSAACLAELAFSRHREFQLGTAAVYAVCAALYDGRVEAQDAIAALLAEAVACVDAESGPQEPTAGDGLEDESREPSRDADDQGWHARLLAIRQFPAIASGLLALERDGRVGDDVRAELESIVSGKAGTVAGKDVASLLRSLDLRSGIVDGMEAEYDFRGAARGRFCRAGFRMVRPELLLREQVAGGAGGRSWVAEEEATDAEARQALTSVGLPRELADAAVNWVSEHDSAAAALSWARDQAAAVRVACGGEPMVASPGSWDVECRGVLVRWLSYAGESKVSSALRAAIAIVDRRLPEEDRAAVDRWLSEVSSLGDLGLELARVLASVRGLLSVVDFVRVPSVDMGFLAHCHAHGVATLEESGRVVGGGIGLVDLLIERERVVVVLGIPSLQTCCAVSSRAAIVLAALRDPLSSLVLSSVPSRWAQVDVREDRGCLDVMLREEDSRDAVVIGASAGLDRVEVTVPRRALMDAMRSPRRLSSVDQFRREVGDLAAFLTVGQAGGGR